MKWLSRACVFELDLLAMKFKGRADDEIYGIRILSIDMSLTKQLQFRAIRLPIIQIIIAWLQVRKRGLNVAQPWC